MLRRFFSLCLFLVFALLNSRAQTIDELRNSGLPLVEIVTEGGVMPTCTIVHAPEGCIGTTITDNQYVAGRMVVTLGVDTLYDSGQYEKGISGMRIKRRGNSTAAYLDQHPYKIKLSRKHDLLGRYDSVFQHKQWLLLSMYTWNVAFNNHETNLLNALGTAVSRIFGMGWTPDFGFVQVLLNGEYQGMYYLMESVNEGKGRVNLKKDGFMVEHDPFWWNEAVWFKTDNMSSVYGYTFKYPDDDDVTDSIKNAIEICLNDFEKRLYAGYDISEVIDYESFAKWILIHDLLGTDDSAGCNKYVCKRSMGSDTDGQDVLFMGPLWDYDSCFRSYTISTIHSFSDFYFPVLFQRDDFVAEYVRLWKAHNDLVMGKLNEYVEEFMRKYDGVFDANIQIHRKKFPYEGKNAMRSQWNEIMQKMEKRIKMMDDFVSEMNGTENIQPINQRREIVKIIDMKGCILSNQGAHLPHGFYLLVYADGTIRKMKL